MGKPKNKSKGEDLEAEEDSDVDLTLNEENQEETKPAGKLSKKDKRKKKKNDDWEDDVANEIAAMSLELNKDNPDLNGIEDEPVTKKEKKKTRKNKQKQEDEEEEEMETPKVHAGKKKQTANFAMLMMDDDDDDDAGEKSQSEEESKKEEEQVVETSSKQKKKEKTKKKGKEKKADDEDLDALLAEIEQPKEKKSKKAKKKEKAESMETEEGESQKEAEGQDQKEVGEIVVSEPKVVSAEDLEDEDDRKKRKKKKKKDQDEDEEKEEKDEGEEEEGGTMKTAAQKRKEKKEREKQKKLLEKKKQKAKESTEDKGDKSEEATTSATAAEGDENAAKDEGGDEEEEKEGKKKKKKKGEKEKEEKKKKSKPPVAAMKAMLRQLEEEKERLRLEEEERIRKEEEEIKRLEEQKRLEEERKQKKKEKEKARKERLKAEGKLLSEKEKQQRRRAQQLLESMKEQGLELPSKEEVKKKRPVYDNKKKKKQQQDVTQTESTPSPTEEEKPVETPVETPTTEEIPEAPQEDTAAPVEEEEDDDAKDAWDISSDEEEESPMETETEKTKEVKEEKVEAKKEEEEEEESEEDEEDSEEESDEESEEESSEEESESDDERSPVERAREKIQKRREQAEKNRSTDNLRAPVVCVLGHVDTGKTKILDKLRRTNVQDGEAGGITQQIGATNVPHEAIKEKTTMCKEFQKNELKLPGLLIIDTPGHESFSNLRSRGSSLCDIAILVVDIMHGLEPQTIESINLLKERKTPFLVALNKVDRLYQWKSNPNSDILNTIKRQSVNTRQEFDERAREVIVQMAEQSLNAALFYENKNPKEYISLVPTSAHTGDGMGNLVALICELTQTWLAKRVSYSEELHATVMEVKALPGLGTTIDVILVNGKLKESDTIVIAGTEGPITTQIRGLLMPQPMKELRVKAQYEHHKEVVAAQGVKLIGKDFEKALAGLPLYVAHDDDEVEFYREELAIALKEVLNAIKLSERGVFVQASTLGSLEALLEFLKTSNIPYAGINIGPVHKKDIMKASIMLEHDSQYAVILAFDVKVERDAQELADSLGVKIFTADIIYHLFDKFMAYRDQMKKQKQEEFKHIAVFPCKIRVLPQYIFNSRDPIVVGVSVEAGFVKCGTPICVPSKEFLDLGRITSVEVNHKPVDVARKGQEVCIKIENPGDTPKMYGRHFEHTDLLVSKVSRASIDAVKDHFREEMQKTDWQLLVELKKLFQIL